MDESPGSRQHIPSADEVAGALADAFLAAADADAAAWTAKGLRLAAATCLGGPRPFAVAVVGHVLEAYHRPPWDSPREMSTRILGSPGFAAAIERAAKRKPVRIAVRTIAPSRARSPELPSTLPELARLVGVDVGHLAWFADTKLWNRRAPDGPLHHYRYEWRERPGRTPRLLEVPLETLKGVQRAVLDELLAPMPLHDAAHGFVAGRSAATGAARHTGRDVVIGLDLVSFFASVSARRVYSVFRQAGLPESVAHTLTGVCTHAVPVRVLAAMPAGGSSVERFALHRALAMPHLPQGSPTSPALANLVLRRLDSRLAGWAAAADATYTRYADDLAFSGDGAVAERVDAFVRGVARIVADEGYAVNPHKTRVRRQGVRQSVTGIVVNDVTSAGRAEFDALKAQLHNCVTMGPRTQDPGVHGDYRAHLLGRIAWFSSLNPSRGVRLRHEFDLIRW